MLVLNSKITILYAPDFSTGFAFKGVNEVVIKESAKDYLNTCSIKLPASKLMKSDGKSGFESVQISNKFTIGDAIIVELGYNGILKKEFSGFITQPSFTSPAQIDCEGFSWILRKKKHIKQTWGETDLVTVLKVVVKGTGITLHKDIPKIPILNLKVEDNSGTEVIEYIKELFKGVVVFRLIGNVLWAGLTYQDINQDTVLYQDGYNVISADDLKYKQAEDVNVKVVFKFKGGEQDKDGIANSNPKLPGIVRKEVVSVTDDPVWLKKLAAAKQQQETYTGFEGSINTFLIPYCRAGDRLDFKSKRYPDKNGIYFCSGVETSFGQGGGRRKVELDIKLA